MVSAVDLRCKEPGCFVYPTFNFPNVRPAIKPWPRQPPRPMQRPRPMYEPDSISGVRRFFGFIYFGIFLGGYSSFRQPHTGPSSTSRCVGPPQVYNRAHVKGNNWVGNQADLPTLLFGRAR